MFDPRVRRRNFLPRLEGCAMGQNSPRNYSETSLCVCGNSVSSGFYPCDILDKSRASPSASAISGRYHPALKSESRRARRSHGSRAPHCRKKKFKGKAGLRRLLNQLLTWCLCTNYLMDQSHPFSAVETHAWSIRSGLRRRDFGANQRATRIWRTPSQGATVPLHLRRLSTSRGRAPPRDFERRGLVGVEPNASRRVRLSGLRM